MADFNLTAEDARFREEYSVILCVTLLLWYSAVNFLCSLPLRRVQFLNLDGKWELIAMGTENS